MSKIDVLLVELWDKLSAIQDDCLNVIEELEKERASQRDLRRAELEQEKNETRTS